jgi:hypothetical protein
MPASQPRSSAKAEGFSLSLQLHVSIALFLAELHGGRVEPPKAAREAIEAKG